jgi:hypothetical protein
LLLTVISNVNVVVDDILHEPVEIDSLPSAFEVLLLFDVFARDQYFVSVDLMQLLMEYMGNHFLFKLEFEVVECTI